MCSSDLPRAEGHHDEIARLRQNRPPPGECFTQSFLKALWYLGGTEGSATVQAGMTAEAIGHARRMGFRYVVVYPSLYEKSFAAVIGRSLSVVMQVLTEHLGTPIYRDSQVVVFALPEGG